MHTILIAGAALVGLPILLHLIMKQEPMRLSFPAFRFLTQKLKTNQRKLRLRHFILQALDLLGSMSPQSRVAIVETGDGAADWFRSVSDAQAHLRGPVEPIKQARS